MNGRHAEGVDNRAAPQNGAAMAPSIPKPAPYKVETVAALCHRVTGPGLPAVGSQFGLDLDAWNIAAQVRDALNKAHELGRDDMRHELVVLEEQALLIRQKIDRALRG